MTGQDEKPAGPKYGFPADSKGFLFPPILWALFFVTVYSVQGAGCAIGWNRPALWGFDAIQVTLLVLSAVVIAVLIAVGIWSWRVYRVIAREHQNEQTGDHVRQSRFLAAGAALNAGLFSVACLWTSIPALWSQSCGGLS